MKITPDLECNVVEVLKSHPVEGPQRAALLLLVYELSDADGCVFATEEEIAKILAEQWDELLGRALEMARRLEAPAA